MSKIGFIGLGIMGTPDGGQSHRRRPRAVRSTRAHASPEELTQGGGVACAKRQGRRANDPTSSSSWCPIRPMSRRCCSATTASPKGLAQGKIVVDMSSISPIATKEFAEKINALGADYLDAPVSGGEVGAKAASLTIMVGGPEEAVSTTVKPIFEKMGKNITLVGGNGDGQTTKVANQIIVALNIEAVGEALLFASKAGADPARVRQALMGGFAASRILEVHGERMIKRTFRSGLPHRAASEGSEPRAAGRARRSGVALPNTGCGAGAVQRLRSRMAARPGIIRAWCARSRSWPTTRSATRLGLRPVEARHEEARR